MKYSMKELFDFMDSERVVQVTDSDGNTHVGRCWAYGDIQNEEDYGVKEASIDIGPGLLLFASEIEKIEFAD